MRIDPENAAKRPMRNTALMETAEIMSDKRFMASLRQGLRDVKAGRLIPWEDVKRKIGNRH